MIPGRSVGAVVSLLSFLMLSGLAMADVGEPFHRAGEELTGTDFDLALSVAAPSPAESELANGLLSDAFSKPAAWALAVLAHGTRDYFLTGGSIGGSGFTGVTLEATTTTPAGYFGGPVALASTPVPTSFVPEPSTASFLITGIFLLGTLQAKFSLAKNGPVSVCNTTGR